MSIGQEADQDVSSDADVAPPQGGGWLPGLERIQGEEKRQGQETEEGARVLQAERTEKPRYMSSINE